MVEEREPLRRVSSRCFIQHLPYVPVRTLYPSIHFRIIGRNSYSLNPIFLLQPGNCSLVPSSVIRNNFHNTPPPTNDIFKNPNTNGLPILIFQRSSLHPGSHSTSTMSNMAASI